MKKCMLWIMLIMIMLMTATGIYAAETQTAADTSANAETVKLTEPDSVVASNEPAGSGESILSGESNNSADSGEGFYNILLIGVDRRDESWNGNSDTMVLVTVNEKKEEIWFTSFLRDLYADIPGYGVHKLNAACAIGGPALCIETIKTNYKVDIDNYAYVDFNDMIEIVDALGGIDLEIEDYEISVSNSIISGLCAADGEPADGHLIISAGMQHLDGYQALGFARNRYSGNDFDFGRTGRQRKVLLAIADKFKNTNIASLALTAPKIMGYLQHDLDAATQLQLLTKVKTWMHYDMQQQHVPYDNEWYSQHEILIPTDMEGTLQKIHDTIYGEP
ncbi:MAG: LCP family protein [Blautia sp.]|nr:LCP family protein [Blautia sp.]